MRGSPPNPLARASPRRKPPRELVPLDSPSPFGPSIGRNPFATRYVRPGAVPYLFPRPDTLKQLTDRLESLHWWAMIVGPHGSGKTSLLTHLIPACQQRGRDPLRYTLRDRQRHLPRRAARGWHQETLVIVDGYEQLSWRSRRWLRWCCWRRGCGLLITAHRPGVLPVLYRTEPDLPLVQEIVDRLLKSHGSRISPRSQITRDDVRRAVANHGSNVREVLFELYDVYQLRS